MVNFTVADLRGQSSLEPSFYLALLSAGGERVPESDEQMPRGRIFTGLTKVERLKAVTFVF